jgi:hypothetical protein
MEESKEGEIDNDKSRDFNGGASIVYLGYSQKYDTEKGLA